MAKSNDEIKIKIKERRNRRHARVARLRPLKNLIWWFTGMLSGVLVFVGIIAVAFFVVPVKNYANLAGLDTSHYVSDGISSKSIFGAVSEIGNNTIGELPVLRDAISTVIGDATLFEYSKVEGEVDPQTDGTNAKLYYFQQDGTYLRAFNDDGTRVDGVTKETPLYYVNLNNVKMGEFISLGKDRLLSVPVMNALNGMGVNLGEDNLVEEIFDGVKLNQLTNFDFNAKLDTIKLTKVLGEYETNQDTYDILIDATGKPIEELLVGDLKNNGIEVDNIKLNTVLPYDEGVDGVGGNKKLYDILLDVVNSDLEEGEQEKTKDDIVIGNLGDFDTDKIKLVTVLGESSDNKILDALINPAKRGENPPVTIGNISTEINALDVALVYDINVFREDTDAFWDSNKTRYSLEEGTNNLVIDPNGNYQISETAGVWLFMLYSTDADAGFDENGSANRYVYKGLKVESIDTAIGDISGELLDATIKQFVESGMLSGSKDYSAIHTDTIEQVIDRAAGIVTP